VEAPLFKGQHYSASPWGSLISSTPWRMEAAASLLGRSTVLGRNIPLGRRTPLSRSIRWAAARWAAAQRWAADKVHRSLDVRRASDDRQYFLKLLIEMLKWRQWPPTRCCNHWSFHSQ
jgi:hypothetical protein